MKTDYFLLIMLLLFCSNVFSQIDDSTRDEIDFLITTVTESECIFNRNGTDYAGDEAVKHINTKYDYFISKIKTAEDFITYAATKSEFSGRKYTVTCKSKEPEYLGLWLLERLHTTRD